ncbi:hypothetical protein [Nocardia vaccinii]|uniref:hypothetical protein n=1 Tax=Nocardia vaccinii TaxID=1822 RepID=UPI00082FE534|nr:hypothetical protein [Nocardia vaccinii]
MISKIRRIATIAATTAVLAGAGAGIASATPTVAEPAHTWWGDSYCAWNGQFNWHYYNFCDRYVWHGSHDRDWRNFRDHNHGYDFDWFRGR